ncbi:MAG TPA: YraN family protein [Deltaproteobacteria bacterium]|nr:YraN family protein [Deltaproteobacteria bacterium]
MSTSANSELGRRGEDEAARLLTARGYRILARNYRTRRGEVDIVAADGDAIVFVEVKTRAGAGFGAPAAAVDARKMRRMTLASRAFLALHGLEDRPARFDVVSVEIRDGRTRCELIKNAFDAPD